MKSVSSDRVVIPEEAKRQCKDFYRGISTGIDETRKRLRSPMRLPCLTALALTINELLEDIEDEDLQADKRSVIVETIANGGVE
ncbi:hypothetical protein [Polycladidibacter hongkongensis]|uniref:hypothetical protein n=1 Tax=Polycladidibacter hongkongensis TaxID=1647556 RepID=UPI00082FAFD1|nr:hypothetical protein [Pseudovibrio hongkongensis]